MGENSANYEFALPFLAKFNRHCDRDPCTVDLFILCIFYYVFILYEIATVDPISFKKRNLIQREVVSVAYILVRYECIDTLKQGIKFRLKCNNGDPLYVGWANVGPHLRKKIYCINIVV